MQISLGSRKFLLQAAALITACFPASLAGFCLSGPGFCRIGSACGSRILEHDQEMAPSIRKDLESGYFKIHILDFTIAFDLYIFLSDGNTLLLFFCLADRSLQIEQQAFSSHLQNV